MPNIRLPLVALLFAAITLGACGDDGGANPGSDDGDKVERPENGGELEVIARDFSFSPNELTIQPGETAEITFANDGNAPHTFTSEDLGIDERVEPGSSTAISITAEEEGEFGWLCAIHPQMTGTIIVGEGGDGAGGAGGGSDDLDY